jgi:hypothetical protein
MILSHVGNTPIISVSRVADTYHYRGDASLRLLDRNVVFKSTIREGDYDYVLRVSAC